MADTAYIMKFEGPVGLAEARAYVAGQKCYCGQELVVDREKSGKDWIYIYRCPRRAPGIRSIASDHAWGILALCAD